MFIEHKQYIQLGDYEFEQLFKENFKSLSAYANTFLKDVEAAKEIAQTVFYKLWIKRESISIEYSMSAYLYKSIHNECMNYIKHGKVKTAYLKEMKHEENIVISDERTTERELRKKINDVIKRLPEQCATIFCMSRFEELKYKEIAERLGISIKAVEKQITKALKILRVELKEYLPLILIMLFGK
ncbi:hypothetical protein A9P82_13855 [Arachidicoccus ginsenosidimutans]|uniref:RNA polymerase sigma-70 factor n=1 Tax=Arachidicoccus sp. BS20 TaxID=1850526 RepID=UPI0007F16A3F|nr:RNA polymerase sigma-70 factor [Arachidicoccus sp. BS20]ANI90281.1 hypothetical protein A9P82_13855 [Arachidicoccus sp. BS20]